MLVDFKAHIAPDGSLPEPIHDAECLDSKYQACTGLTLNLYRTDTDRYRVYVWKAYMLGVMGELSEALDGRMVEANFPYFAEHV